MYLIKCLVLLGGLFIIECLLMKRYRFHKWSLNVFVVLVQVWPLDLKPRNTSFAHLFCKGDYAQLIWSSPRWQNGHHHKAHQFQRIASKMLEFYLQKLSGCVCFKDNPSNHYLGVVEMKVQLEI